MLDLRPSGSHIWTNCDANPLFASQVPEEPESDAAREGTCAAWVAEMILTGAVQTGRDLLGTAHENGWIVTPDMIQFIERYVEMVRSRGGTVHVERKVRLNKIIAGTPDGYAVLHDDTLHVDDLKYGHLIVEPYKNTQVSIYAGAILRMLMARGALVKRVVIGIYQPRPWHPSGIYRTWSVHPERLMEFVHTIEAAGQRCQNPTPTATAGDWCTFCPAKTSCHANAKAVYAMGEHAMSNQRANMKPIDLAQELEFLGTLEKMVTSRLKAIKAEATARVRKGEVLPGWHIEHPLGDRQFKVPLETVAAITGVNPYTKKPMTPATLEKDERVSPTVIASLVHRPNRPPVLKKVPKGYYENVFK